MDGFLKQSTAGQVRTVGPFVDDGDFVTLENGLTIANTDILIKKNGGASAAKNSGGATADTAGGMYHLTWDATDTATVGQLFYSIKVAGALVVFGTFTVLEEAVYDALFGASAVGPLLANSTGSGLSAIPWNSAWDPEVQSECADAIVAFFGANWAAGIATLMATTVDGVALSVVLTRIYAGSIGRRDISGTDPYTIECYGPGGTIIATITATGGGGTVVYS